MENLKNFTEFITENMDDIQNIGDETQINNDRHKKLGKILNDINWTKKQINKELHKITTGSGNNNKKYQSIPLDEIFNVLDKYGLIALQEDDTKWSGMLMGRDEHTYFDLAWKSSGYERDDIKGVKFYVPLPTAKLSLSWYTYDSGKIEITTYIG